MSDFNLVDKKIQEGVKWTGSVNISIGGEQASVAIRQLNDPELREILDMIDRDELGGLQDELPDDLMDEYRELTDKDELSEQESARLEELEEELNEVDILDYISTNTFNGIATCAKYCIVPDEEDLMRLFNDNEFVNKVEEEYGITVKQPIDLYEREADIDPEKPSGPAKDYMQMRLRQSTDFTTFVIGMQALMETMGDEKNSENTLHQTTGHNL